MMSPGPEATYVRRCPRISAWDRVNKKRRRVRGSRYLIPNPAQRDPPELSPQRPRNQLAEGGFSRPWWSYEPARRLIMARDGKGGGETNRGMGPFAVLFLEDAVLADSLSLTTARCSISLRFILSKPKWSASSWACAFARNFFIEIGFLGFG
jgi:hypothetical protein